MDLRKCREGKLLHNALRLLVDYPKRCIWHDQTALNVGFAGNCAYMDSDLNYQLKPGRELFIDELESLKAGALNIHYVTGSKPWIRPGNHLSHRIFRALHAGLSGSRHEWTSVQEAGPVYRAAVVNWIKGARLRGWSFFRDADSSKQLKRLADSHFRSCRSLFREGRHNASIREFLSSLSPRPS